MKTIINIFKSIKDNIVKISLFILGTLFIYYKNKSDKFEKENEIKDNINKNTKKTTNAIKNQIDREIMKRRIELKQRLKKYRKKVD